MRRFDGFSGLLGACLFLALGGCTVYVVPAEEAGTGPEDEPTPAGVAVSDGTEGSEEAKEDPDGSTDAPAAVAGVERRPDTASVGVAVEAPSDDQRRGAQRRARRRARVGARQLHVPPGHHPSRGECRIWYEDRPPGRQPAPAPCDRLLADRYPAGAFILYGGESWDGDHDWPAVAVEFPGAVPRPVIALSERVGGDAEPAATPAGRREARDGTNPDSVAGAAGGAATGAAAVGTAIGGAAVRPDSRPAADSDREAPGRAENSDGSAREGDPSPRQVRVPSRHRPPESRCRVWYEGRPVGRQEPHRPCEDLVDRDLEAGAFILYGNRAFDVQHDWTAAEAEEPGTVPVALLDLLVGSPDAGSEGDDLERSGSESAEVEKTVEEDGGTGSGAAGSSTDDAPEDDSGSTRRGTTPVVDLPDADSQRPGDPRR